MTHWVPDVLGRDYEQHTIALGTDPDGEGEVVATLVRHTGSGDRGAFLHVHGYTDYFFQTGLAEHLVAQGYTFYALDLRKCGRSIRPGHTPHFVSNLALYDAELDAALDIVGGEGHRHVLLGAHSTGGLIVPLWLDRRRAAGHEPVAGLLLNSPWFDLQGPGYYRSAVATGLIDAIGRIAPLRIVPIGGGADAYGTSLHRSRGGEWDYDLTWKPLVGFPARFGWLRAVRRGHARLHQGLDVGCPSLVLRSTRSHFVRAHEAEVDTADGVLDVAQIARWAGCLGGRTTVAPIAGARHDAFLSQPAAREAAYAELDSWLLRGVAAR